VIKTELAYIYIYVYMGSSCPLPARLQIQKPKTSRGISVSYDEFIINVWRMKWVN